MPLISALGRQDRVQGLSAILRGRTLFQNETAEENYHKVAVYNLLFLQGTHSCLVFNFASSTRIGDVVQWLSTCHRVHKALGLVPRH